VNTYEYFSTKSALLGQTEYKTLYYEVFKLLNSVWVKDELPE
jgi:hypothetical protein